jgi:hypothetical protein
MQPHYNFSRNGKTYKQVEIKDKNLVVQLIIKGEIHPTDFYWKPGMREWASVSSCDWTAPDTDNENAPQVAISKKSKLANFVWLIIISAILATVSLTLIFLRKSPLQIEFYREKNRANQICFKVWLANPDAIPYEEFTWKVTRVTGVDGKTLSFSYPIKKSVLINGIFLNSPGFNGVNPFGSDCHGGDKWVIEIVGQPALVFEIPGSTKTMKVREY